MKEYIRAAPAVLAYLQTTGLHHVFNIARAAKASESTVHRSIRWLRDHGVEVEARHGEGYSIDPSQAVLSALRQESELVLAYFPSTVAEALDLPPEATSLALALTRLRR